MLPLPQSYELAEVAVITRRSGSCIPKELGELSQALRRECGGHTMIATGCSDNSGEWNFFGQQIVKRSSRSEGTGVL